jgi:hypothetical protein
MTADVQPPGQDRRVAPRRRPAMGTICRLDAPDGGPVLALVWNISRSGVSMLLSSPIPAGTRLSGILELMAGDTMQRVAMTVVHLKQLDTGDYYIGAHFDEPLTDELMKPFVAAE